MVLDTVLNVISGIILKICEIIFSPFKEAFQYFESSPDKITSFSFFNPIYDRLLTIGLALFILIVTWQSFKAMFAWMGFECEEPWRIAARAIAFGFLVLNAKNVCLQGILKLFSVFSEFLWRAYDLNGSLGDNLGGFFSLPGTDFLSGGLEPFLILYLYFKFIKLAFRFAERLIVSTFCVLGSPLAFAAGCTQPTKGFFQGWLKLFIGNLVIQLLQIAMFISIVMYYAQDNTSFGVIRFVLVTSIIKVLEKLEDILRDISVSVGVGRDFSSAMQKATQAIHTGVQIHSVTKVISGLFGKGG